MGFILHATYQPTSSQVIFWAEDDHVRGRKTKRKPEVPPHPFTMSSHLLKDWMQSKVGSTQPQAAAAAIWLPSDEHGPQPSPDLVANGSANPLEPDRLSLRAWTVEACVLSISDSLDLLLTLDDPTSRTPDLIFWKKAALYALSLAAGQQIIPTLERDGFRLRALWKAQPENPEVLANLAGQMPPLCRALAESLDKVTPARTLLESFVNAVVDNTIRQAVRSLNLRYPRTPGGQWLSALTSPNNQLNLQGSDGEELFKTWYTWSEQSTVAGNAAFRIAFRLDAPEKDHAPWKLHYLLQAADDPSLIVSAEELWRGKGDQYLRQRFDNAQERLLRGLAFAGRLFDPIMKSLRSTAPEHAAFDTEQAFSFLKEIAPLLQGSGFRVLLPRWWGGKSARLSAKAKIKSGKTSAKSILSLENLVNYEWQVMLGGEPISREEFERLAALKQPLVMIRGQWVMLDAEQVTAGLKFFDRMEGQINLNEALRLGLDSEDATLNNIPVDGLQVNGWLKTLLETLQKPEQIETRPPPPELRAELRPYQERGFSWLAFLRRYGLGACLADDMGLGKTIQAIALLLHERRELKITAPALLVCPTSVVGNWRRELARFAPDLKALTHQGAERELGEKFALRLQDIDIVLTSYPLLARDRESLEGIEWSTLILDEAQNIKNNSTKQAQAARAMRAGNRIALTGTPVENRLSELWSIFNFLNPGYLGSENHFRKYFANPIERVNDLDAAKHLKALTTPFILRRLKTDPKIISDLPEKLEMKVYCNLSSEQGTLYEAVVKNIMEEIEGAETEGDSMSRRGLVLSMLMQLKQICNHPAQYLKDGSTLDGRSGKLARLTEMLEEVYAAGDRALVFTQFAEMGELLRAHLRSVYYDDPLWLHGATKIKDRENMIRRFQAEKGPTVFLLSIKAGGVGLNLTRANHVFHFDRWWNPAVENQATDRAFRIGQTRNVQVHKFICAGTLEEKIDEMIESKKALAERVIGADESWLTELSSGDLRELVKLRETGD